MFERKPPIRSAFEDDPDLAEEISDFVVGLAEYVDALQDAELDGSLGKLCDMTSTLLADARRFGYPPLAEAAAHVIEACKDAKREAAGEALLVLTEVSYRVRRGHRGAA